MPDKTVTEQEFYALRLVERIALGLLARYPFDTAEQMQPRWDALALALSATKEP